MLWHFVLNDLSSLCSRNPNEEDKILPILLFWFDTLPREATWLIFLRLILYSVWECANYNGVWVFMSFVVIYYESWTFRDRGVLKFFLWMFVLFLFFFFDFWFFYLFISWFIKCPFHIFFLYLYSLFWLRSGFLGLRKCSLSFSGCFWFQQLIEISQPDHFSRDYPRLPLILAPSQ